MHIAVAPLPPREDMVAAMLARDPAYEGVFFTAVLTTRIFCRPTCAARKPLPANVVFYASTGEAQDAGFRACLRCRPLALEGEHPGWLKPLLQAVECDPQRRWTQAEMAAFGIAPARARAWCKQRFGSTFSSYVRMRRLGQALLRLNAGENIDAVAMDTGYDSVSGFRDAFRKAFGVPAGQAASRRVLHYRRLATPLGPMLAMADAAGIVRLEFQDRPALPAELDALRRHRDYAAVPGDHPHLRALEAALGRYFRGTLRAFDLPLNAHGTPFQRQVWDALRQLPPGSTCSYAALARAIGRPAAVPAVAAANARNPLALLVPCHRVVASDGSLGGYGGGLARKAFLLELERQQLASTTHLPPLLELSA